MLFVSLKFIGFFLVVFLVFWRLESQRRRLQWLFVASIYFYMSWNPWLIGLIVVAASVAFAGGLAIERSESSRRRKVLLLGVISINLGLLIFFKYANFFLDTAYVMQSWLGGSSDRRLLQIILPLGISFYTFETISYAVDIYRRRIQAERNLLQYAVFIMFFPRLIAGPIVRPHEFLPQTRRFRRFNWDRIQLGLQFFLLGVFKKAALADQLALAIDPVFANPGNFNSGAVWLAALGYSVQIYLDFSGYSDMAIGLAHLLGFHLTANFNLPYLARNIGEFWRRWHISLSTWLRDYLFIPLGGSRAGQWNTCRNLMIVMLLGGLWHGANWTFVFWGGYIGLLLVVHRLMKPHLPAHPALTPIYVAFTFLTVCLGFVLFRSPSLPVFGSLLERLFTPTTGESLAAADYRTVVAVLMITALGYAVAAWMNLRRLERRAPAWLAGGALAATLFVALMLIPEDGRAFIYFQF